MISMLSLSLNTQSSYSLSFNDLFEVWAVKVNAIILQLLRSPQSVRTWRRRGRDKCLWQRWWQWCSWCGAVKQRVQIRLGSHIELNLERWRFFTIGCLLSHPVNSPLYWLIFSQYSFRFESQSFFFIFVFSIVSLFFSHNDRPSTVRIFEMTDAQVDIESKAIFEQNSNSTSPTVVKYMGDIASHLGIIS